MGRFIRDNIEAFAVAIAMALVIRHYCIEAFRIPTHSMKPTLYGDHVGADRTRRHGDRILVDKFVYQRRDPRRYEVLTKEYVGENGRLTGVKTVLTEFVAFLQLSEIPTDDMTARTRIITVHALCGFANFGSIGILIGGLTIIEPDRRATFLQLAWKTLIVGTLATCLSGAVVGTLPVQLFTGAGG